MKKSNKKLAKIAARRFIRAFGKSEASFAPGVGWPYSIAEAISVAYRVHLDAVYLALINAGFTTEALHEHPRAYDLANFDLSTLVEATP